MSDSLRVATAGSVDAGDAAGASPTVQRLRPPAATRRKPARAQASDPQLLAVADALPDAISFKDLRGRFTHVNRTLAAWYGLADPAEAVGKTDFDFLPADLAKHSFEQEQQIIRSAQPLLDEVQRHTLPGAREAWISTTTLPLRDAAGGVVGTFRLSRDVSAFKHAEERQQRSEALYHSLIETIPLHVSRKDLDGRFTFANHLFCKALGRPPAEILGKTDFDFYPRELAQKYARDDQQVIRTAQPLELTEEHQMPGGGRTCVQVVKTPILGSDGRVAGTQCLFWDVTARTRADEERRRLDDELERRVAEHTAQAERAIRDLRGQIQERKQAQAALEYQVLHDGLTGLPNRSLLEDRLEQGLLAAQRDEAPLALMVLDLDGFKEINATLGHQAGDGLLREVGQRLREALPPSNTVARLGGDEFALLLPQTDLVRATLAAEAVLAALKPPFLLAGQPIGVEASIGIVIYPQHGQTAEALRRQAGVAMGRAKRSGSGYLLYTGRHDRQDVLRLVLMGELRQAIEREELELYYQPKGRLPNGDLAGVEALLRWPHPQRGLILPDQFIPLAEGSGLIKPLDRWVLAAALRQCRAWHQAGWTIPVAVNLSSRNLQDPHLPDTVAELLRAFDVPAGLLELEVTESAVMADPAQAEEILARLRALGVQVALDDFGTGYSSLGRLKHLPVDEIKLDRQFVTEMASDTNDLAIVRAGLDLGHHLGLRVVAEGIEDAATWDLLASLGCDVGQGYHLSRPLPAAELEAWLSGSSPGAPGSRRA